MIMRDAVVEGSGNFDHLGLFNVHPNLSTRAYNISAFIGNAATAAGIQSRDLRISSRVQRYLVCLVDSSEEKIASSQSGHLQFFRVFPMVLMMCLSVSKNAYETSAYEAASEYTSEGVIRGVLLEDSTRDIAASVVTLGNPTALVAKRLSKTTAVIVLFEGFRASTHLIYNEALLRCTLYRKQIDTCYHCGRPGHRVDVCPNPQGRICRQCGAPSPLPPNTTSVHPHANSVEATPRQLTGPAEHATRPLIS
ncbi:hypothetical protein HPB51_004646 [Rhipicephalus microplus]|uniref:CCHC-type domain-containing protein n=1 Tax=Rhipicephalus microplus TaxID=6941 RepID=A0A9J6EFN9_RHIMP|nr:hypothetical protein HPB51_004646 [Rhipicephalus microplus]